MKKARNTFLLALALLSVVSMGSVAGTYAKYTSTTSVTDTARVAKWDIQDGAITDWDLFGDSMNQSNLTDNKDTSGNKVIAPGSKGSADFAFDSSKINASTTEVDYEVKLSNVTVNDTIGRIKYTLKEGSTVVQDSESTNVENLNAADLTTALAKVTFEAGKTYTLEWEWVNTDDATNNTADTTLGQAGTATVTVNATITASQIVK